VLTETVFSWPGVGNYAVEASRRLDYPAIIGVTILGGIAFLLDQPRHGCGLRLRRPADSPVDDRDRAYRGGRQGRPAAGRRGCAARRSSPSISIGMWVIVAVTLAAVVPARPARAVGDRLLSPNAHNWMGTDALGRDVFTAHAVGRAAVVADLVRRHRLVGDRRNRGRRVCRLLRWLARQLC
jgi:hypothetical protein